MADTIIKVENLSKHYNLGTINSGTLYRDMQSWWARIRGKEDPNTQIGAGNAEQMSQDNSFWALKDVSFEVKRGDVVGIIGRNGAGKSTLLKILSRVTGPTAGNIKIKGRVASLLEVGTGFHPELTGRENVYLNGTILGMRKSEIDKKFDEIVAFAEIEKFIDTPVKRYSSGMYVRLAFAVAAHLDPEILIVDEVLAVGDVEFQKKCLIKINNIALSGKSVLLVSHNMETVKALSNKCLYLDSGRVKQFGISKDVLPHYMSFLLNDTMQRENILYAKREKSTQKAKFFNIKTQYFDKVGNELEIPVVGCDIKFTLSMMAIKDFSSANVSLVIYDRAYSRLIETHLMSKGKCLNMKSGEHKKIIMALKNVLLRPDDYIVSVWSGIVGVEDIDWVENATMFRIIPRREDQAFHKLLEAKYFCQYDVDIKNIEDVI